MKTLIYCITALLLITGSSVTFAKIGENEWQIQNRYGKPVTIWDDYLGPKKLYHWRGYDVTVIFVNGISQREAFMKTKAPFDDDQKFLAKISGAGRNGVIVNEDGEFTTKVFEQKYAAAERAWGETGK